MEALWSDLGYVTMYAANVVGFVAMYFAFALAATFLCKKLGQPISARAVTTKQLTIEIKRSMVAILSFSLWGPVVLALDRSIDVVRFDHDPLRIALELCAVFMFNELHFMACHRLLHTRWLYRHVHSVHHRSTTPSPFTTYSLHPIEAFMLGSVMIPILLVASLDVVTLVVWPVISIFFNTLGHAAHTLPFGAQASRDHHAHHTKGREHYGFFVL
jgi:Delta7-sterol 5-desaturase